MTVSLAVLVNTPNDAERVATPVVATGWVVTVNVAVLDPAATVTEVGTEANAESEARITTAPPPGAIPVRVTVQVELAPPYTEGGTVMSEVSCGASTPSLAVFVTPLRTAEIVAETFELTAVGVTAKVAEDPPAGLVTDGGTVAARLLDASDTVVPPVGAGPLRVTVPVDPSPPKTNAGLRARPLRTGGAMPRF